MNDLRLILLGIGLLIIALIYIWGTFRQKSQDRSRSRKIISFKQDSFAEVKAMPVYDEDEEVSAETLMEMDAFLAKSENQEFNKSDFSLSTKSAKPDQSDLKLSKSVPEKPDESLDQPVEQKKQLLDAVDDGPRQKISETRVITFLIKASQGNTFSGVNILQASKAVGLKFGNMNIFHHHGVEGMESEENIFSMASMYEPGYFDLEKMKTFETRGLALFMQLPVSIDNILAFDLMQETAMGLADVLQGEIWSSKHKPINEKSLQAMRDIVIEYS